MATWPTGLPLPLTSGYVIAPKDQTLRTDMESGASRVRRRSVARNDQVTVQFVFTDAQLATFRAWFDNAAEGAGGAAWFTIRLPIGTGGFSVVEARFLGPVKANAAGGLIWSISGELEVR